ncbi:MAG: SBBP repeat-containing protein [Candidatus Kariarchaeaceae archaeon]|jgi:hypothetical protein
MGRSKICLFVLVWFLSSLIFAPIVLGEKNQTITILDLEKQDGQSFKLRDASFPTSLIDQNSSIKQSIMPNAIDLQSIDQDMETMNFDMHSIAINETKTDGNPNKLVANYVWDVASDSQNNIVVGGQIQMDVIHQSGYTNAGASFGYISKLKENSQLLWTYMLGNVSNIVFGEITFVTSVSVDSSDNIIATGITKSANFSTTSGAYDETYNGQSDIFLTKINSQGEMLWSTYLGGSNTESTNFEILDDIWWDPEDLGEWVIETAVDSEDNIILTGQSSSQDFPTIDAEQSELAGDNDAITCKFNSEGELIWSTFLGGSAKDYGISTAIDRENSVYIAGISYSNDFPTTENSFQQDTLLVVMQKNTRWIWH